MDCQEAISNLNNVIEIDPEGSSVFYFRAHVKVNLENFQGAVNYLCLVIDISPMASEAYRNGCAARELINDLEGVCQDWRKVVDLVL